MHQHIIAVDPGVNGGVAWIGGDSPRVQAVHMPATVNDSVRLFCDITKNMSGEYVAYIEKISGYIPGAGGMLFEFGRQVERPSAILTTLGIRIIEVTPQNWQKGLSLGNSGRGRVPSVPRGLDEPSKAAWRAAHAEEIKMVKKANAGLKRDWKLKLRGEAQRRFPGLDVTLATCDALLILDYGRMQERE
jgi:hypothetical protein